MWGRRKWHSLSPAEGCVKQTLSLIATLCPTVTTIVTSCLTNRMKAVWEPGAHKCARRLCKHSQPGSKLKAAMPKCKSNIYCNSARCSDYDVPYSEMPCLRSPHKHGISNLPTSATEVVNTLVISKKYVSPNTIKFTPLIYVISSSKKKVQSFIYHTFSIDYQSFSAWIFEF